MTQPKTAEWSQLETAFDKLAGEWIKDTAHHSNPAIIVRHPSYREIIAMGEESLPFIFREIRRKRNRPHWFQALYAITGASPAPEAIWGKVDEVAAAWLNWGREQGYDS